MYSGTVMTKGSGRIIGVHQKIDRIARRRLQPHISDKAWFPKSREILAFEGMNGPDGVKRKTPNKDVPQQFINPDDKNDTELLRLVNDYANSLINSLRQGNRERAAFAAAWLSHIMVDGLTPAHHYPFTEKLAEIRGGDPAERTKLLEYFIMPGETAKDKFINNWDYWKPNGLMTAHGLYELGVALIVAPLRYGYVKLTAKERRMLRECNDFSTVYKAEVDKIHEYKMYDYFLENGLTNNLALQTKDILIPTIIHAVLMAWYYCMYQAFKDNEISDV